MKLWGDRWGIVWAAAVVPLLLLFAWGIVTLVGDVVADQAAAPTPDAVEAKSEDLPADPCSAATSDEEFQQCVEPHIEKAGAEQASFRSEFLASGRDFHDLPRGQLPGDSYLVRDLNHMVLESALIMQVTVGKQSLSIDGGSIHSPASVTKVLKGEQVGEVVLQQTAGVVKGSDGQAYLMVSSLDPLLEQGAEYIVFAKDFDGDGAFAILGPEGQFRVDNSVVTTPGKADWAESSNGKPLDEFLGQLETEIAKAGQ